jgi:UDP-N-acetylmuramoyl-L-alanyl-D-glutamate--2,6-diaminopimelate ligase
MTAPLAHTVEIVDWLRKAAPAAQLSADSRTIASGDIFFAYPGDGADGRQFIPDAIERGAKAIVCEAQGLQWNDAWNVPHLAVDGLRKLAGPIANAYYDRPDEGMTTIAVTGTNGKTSCTQWLGNAMSRLSDPTAVIGTLGAGLYIDGRHKEFNATGYTTPDPIQLQRRLAELRKAGAGMLAIEASSIGLDQGRLDGMHFDIALFTNLTRDHLDYHGDMETYEGAKRQLFEWPGLQHAVVNLDDEAGLRLIEHMKRIGSSVVMTGYTVTGKTVDGIDVLQATDIRTSHGGTVFQLHSRFGSAHVRAQTVGRFNVSNLLGVIGVMLAKGIAFSDAIEAAEELTPVPGRMQQLGGQDAPLVVIDYAHTPDALEKTLASLRQVAEERGGRLWCVFGCGGDRDPGKRPQMGAVAMAADHVIVTSDNPRSEEPKDIIAQIAAGMGADPSGHLEIEDRAAAILWAVRHAAKQDVVLLAGKGHETYQEIKGRKLPFADADHAALALAARATMMGAAS